MTEPHAPLSADQATLASACFVRLVRVVLRRHAVQSRHAEGSDAEGSDVEGSDAEGTTIARRETEHRLEAALYALYPEFQRSYTQLFGEQVGFDHAAEVLRELQSEPLQRYLRARAEMNPELTRRLEELQQRMGSVEV